jgi:type VI secretion system protein ImpE
MIMTPGELYQAGKLKEAIAEAQEGVKKHPVDTLRRGQLAELLCFAGDLDRADKHMEAVAQHDPASLVGVNLFRQLLRAEKARQQFHGEGRMPEFLGEPSPLLKLHLEASIDIRKGDLANAARLLAQAEEQRPRVSGTCDGRPFHDFRDLDDLTASYFEVLTTTGKYYWVPLERVERIEFRAPERPRDVLWRRALMVVRGGPDGEVCLPSTYPMTHAQDDDQLRLARGTQWIEQEGAPVRGIGQREFLVGDQAVSVLELKEIVMA